MTDETCCLQLQTSGANDGRSHVAEPRIGWMTPSAANRPPIRRPGRRDQPTTPTISGVNGVLAHLAPPDVLGCKWLAEFKVVVGRDTGTGVHDQVRRGP